MSSADHPHPQGTDAEHDVSADLIPRLERFVPAGLPPNEALIARRLLLIAPITALTVGLTLIPRILAAGWTGIVVITLLFVLLGASTPLLMRWVNYRVLAISFMATGLGSLVLGTAADGGLAAAGTFSWFPVAILAGSLLLKPRVVWTVGIMLGISIAAMGVGTTMGMIDAYPVRGAAAEATAGILAIVATLAYARAFDMAFRRELEQRVALEVDNISLSAERAAEEGARRSQRTFLSIMAHELRTPLNGVMGMAEALGQGRLDEGQQALVGTLRRSARLISATLDEALDPDNIERGTLHLDTRPFDVSRWVRRTADLHRAHAAFKNLDFHVHIADDVPKTVIGDEVRLAQILGHLLSNAVKFSVEGEVAIYVSTTPGPQPRLRLEVRDRGPGIPEAEKQLLRQPFNTQDLISGRTGHGLLIVRRAVDQVGGTIDVLSAPREGTSVAIDLPLQLYTPAPAITLSGIYRLDFRAILVVDDNAINRIVAQKILEPMACNVTLASSGQAALEAMQTRWDANEGLFDLVLMDCDMPGMDGYEATEAIRAHPNLKTTRVYALTAQTDPELVQRCFDAGMDGHLAKPITPPEFAKLLAKLFPPE